MTTYYVRTTGSDANGGTSVGDAWLTLDHALGETYSNGDIIDFDVMETFNTSIQIPNDNMILRGNGWTSGITIGASFPSGDDVFNDGSFRRCAIENFKLDGNGQSVSGLQASPSSRQMIAQRMEITGFAGSSDVVNANAAVDLYIHDNTSTGVAIGTGDAWGGITNCVCVDNGGDGFDLPNEVAVTNCISANNTGEGFRNVDGNRITYVNCIAYGNGSHGFQNSFGNTTTRTLRAFRCISVANGGYGFDLNGTAETSGEPQLYDCYTQGNTSGSTNGSFSGSVTALANDPFVDGSNNDFTIDSSTAGNVLRAFANGFGSNLSGTFSNYAFRQYVADSFGGGGGSAGGGTLINGGLVNG